MRAAVAARATDPPGAMRILRSILMSLVAAGMLTAAGTAPDGVFATAELVFGVGAFALAWLPA